MAFCVLGLQWPFIFSNLKILCYWVTSVLIDLLGFFIPCLAAIVYTLSINVQSPLIHLRRPSKLHAMAILTIHGSHRIQPSLTYYYHIDYMADSTIVFHVQYPHNIPITLLTTFPSPCLQYNLHILGCFHHVVYSCQRFGDMPAVSRTTLIYLTLMPW